MLHKTNIYKNILLGVIAVLVLTLAGLSTRLLLINSDQEVERREAGALNYGTEDGFLFDGNIGVLVSTTKDKEVHLVSPSGEVLNVWYTDFFAGAASYLDADKNLWRAERTPGETFDTGGRGGQISKYSWDGELLWRFVYDGFEKTLHHDFSVLPNGNVLAIAWNRIGEQELVDLGRQPNITDLGELWVDSIIEIQPNGADSGEIVWEWRLLDHLVQDIDPLLPNYGSLVENRDKFDINFQSDEKDSRDWNHMNSIDFNPDTNEVMVSVRASDEVWIIPKNDAPSSTGILFRYGNNSLFGGANTPEKSFFGQHNAYWHATDSSDESIIVFNNGDESERQYSQVVELNRYNPDNVHKVLYDGNESGLFASFLSGAQLLPDDSLLITDGPSGECFTVNSDTTWRYSTSRYRDENFQIFRCTAYTL